MDPVVIFTIKDLYIYSNRQNHQLRTILAIQ